MKNRALSVLTVIFSLCLLLFACRKEIAFIVYDRDHPSNGLLESAKVWYLQHIDPEAPKIKQYGKLRAYWEDAWTKNTADNGTLLVVPADDYYLVNTDFTFERFVVFKVSGNSATDGKIIELFGQNYDVEENRDFIIKNYDQNTIAGFNGTILQYDVSYQEIKSVVYKNGYRNNKEQVDIQNLSDSQLRNLKKRSKKATQESRLTAYSFGDCPVVFPVMIGFPEVIGEDCMVTVYHQVVYDMDGCVVSDTYTFISMSCPDGCGSGSGGSGYNRMSGSGSGGSGSGSGSGSGGGCGGSPPGGGSEAWSQKDKLCGYYNFEVVGNSYTATILYLQLRWQHNSPPFETFITNFISSCLEIPIYNMTKKRASESFNSAFNYARRKVLTGLNAGSVSPTPIAVQLKLKQGIKSRLSSLVLGASWSTDSCFGDVPQTEATFCR